MQSDVNMKGFLVEFRNLIDKKSETIDAGGPIP